MPGLTTNPNLGIGLGYDGRQDLGYGKNGNSGLGSQWAVTGNAGIYKEKSEYEKELDKDKLENEEADLKSKMEDIQQRLDVIEENKHQE